MNEPPFRTETGRRVREIVRYANEEDYGNRYQGVEYDGIGATWWAIYDSWLSRYAGAFVDEEVALITCALLAPVGHAMPSDVLQWTNDPSEAPDRSPYRERWPMADLLVASP
jgi:hypothetical protein